MKLEEYIKKAIAELEEFETTWRKENLENPDEWPLDLPEGDWMEQESVARSTSI